MKGGWTAEDAMVVAGSRLLADGDVVFAGVGAPLLASVLAQNLHAPGLTIVLEGGYIGPRMLPGKLPISTNEMRGAHGSSMLTGMGAVATPVRGPARGGGVSLAAGLVRSARPKQWLKNVLVFAAPGAAGVLDQWSAFGKTLLAFIAFCLAASSEAADCSSA